jgi:hypothetical protein
VCARDDSAELSFTVTTSVAGSISLTASSEGASCSVNQGTLPADPAGELCAVAAAWYPLMACRGMLSQHGMLC